MDRFSPLKITDFDHLEFAVADLEKASGVWLRAGFEKLGSREILERQLKSHLLAQNQTYILLSASTLRADPVFRFVQTHGDGVFNIALRCDDAMATLDIAANRGADVAEPPKSYRREFGAVHSASIRTVGSVRHTFISREGNLFAEGFEIPMKAPRRPTGIRRIDHLTFYIEPERLAHWASYYERILGLTASEPIQVETRRGSARTRVLKSPNGIILVRLTEPSGDRSPVRDYLDINHGPGVAHAAFASENILTTLRPIQREGIDFRKPSGIQVEDFSGLGGSPAEYLEANIAVERRESGTLLYALSKNMVGPFCLEILQRIDFSGFGEKSCRFLLNTD